MVWYGMVVLKILTVNFARFTDSHAYAFYYSLTRSNIY